MEKDYIVAISFIDYLRAKSGVAKVLMAHQQMYNANSISYIDLFSVKKNICNDKIMLFCKFGLIIDGDYKGIFQMSQIIHMLYKFQNDGYRLLDIHLHHFLYTKIKLVDEFLRACPETPVKVYLHDYFNVCTGYTLMKNREQYCGGMGFSDDICADCQYAEVNKQVQPQIHKIFRENLGRIVFVSPSETTKEIFLNFHPEYADKVIVIPHQKYLEHYQENLEALSSDEKIRVAFLGMPMKHKGWNVWKKLVEKFQGDGYEFTVFNSSDDVYEKMGKVKIGFSQENLNAMTDALRRYKVHIALLWSLCPETYSYACFEAFSANAFIITNRISGNIADVVRTNGNGIVLADEITLEKLFENRSDLINKINSFRNQFIGGPDKLSENNEIISITKNDFMAAQIKNSHKPINYPLIWILNRIYKH